MRMAFPRIPSPYPLHLNEPWSLILDFDGSHFGSQRAICEKSLQLSLIKEKNSQDRHKADNPHCFTQNYKIPQCQVIHS